MSTRTLSAAIFLSTIGVAWAQTIDVTGAKQSSPPQYRPVLIGKGPEALINRIDTQDLINKGQKDGVVMFICAVSKTGEVQSSGTYRAAGDVQFLERELQRKLAGASNPKFIPAIYNRAPVNALYFGTVTFAVVDGKPRLRIFSNQQIEDVNKESDFVGPQPVLGGPSKFSGFRYPKLPENAVPVDGFVEVRLKVDENGNLQCLRVIEEKPPLLGFAIAAINDLTGTKFVPGFRDGKPVACDVTVPIYYRAPDLNANPPAPTPAR
jgi:hypothetical protein